MGIFSKYHRYREAGQDPNVNNVARFGQPAFSLFTSTRILTLRHHIDITDQNGSIAYRADSKVFSLHDRTVLTDAGGREVAWITRKLISLHERHFVTMANGVEFQLSNEIFHLFRDITNIEGLGWQLRGNVWALNFEIYDQNEGVVAVISQKMISLHDKYALDIYRPEYTDMVAAILVTLQHMICDRENASSAGSASSGSY